MEGAFEQEQDDTVIIDCAELVKITSHSSEESRSINVRDNFVCTVSKPLNGVCSTVMSSADAPSDFSNGSLNCPSPPSLSVV